MQVKSTSKIRSSFVSRIGHVRIIMLLRIGFFIRDRAGACAHKISAKTTAKAVNYL